MQIRNTVRNDIESETKRLAELKVKRMETLIDDQLTEAKYEVILRRALFEAAMLGNGVIKAGTVKVVRKLKFEKKEGIKIEAEFKQEIAPGIEGVSVFE